MLPGKDKKFLIARLKNSSIPELIYRAREMFLLWRLQKKYPRNYSNTIKFSKSISLIDSKLPFFQCKITEKHINELLAGKVFMLNCDQSILKSADRKIGDTFFSFIDLKDEPYDLRSIWEPARLQNITALLLYLNANPDKSRSDKVERFCLEQILQWIQKNPFLYGPHYISVMECALRIPVFVYCLMILTNLNSNQIKLILETIFHHGWWISKRISLYSSLGNHSIAESVGLIFAG